jgi:nucleoside-diphosphate-sugar epimerase
VVDRALARDTDHMAGDAGPTVFVTGAAGFIGAELIRVLVARGYQVFGLARSVESTRHLQRAGATAIRGDLLVPGQWQDEAATDWVFHIPPCAPARARSWRRAKRIAQTRAVMDANLLDAVASGATRRIVYVADWRCYGSTGSRPQTEDEVSVSPDRGRCLMPALDRLDGYSIAGLPIVTAVPGCVYGNGSWFRQHFIDPVLAGRRVLQFGKTGPWVSPIHVHDCARALVHLAERGDVGSRYFLADNEPIRMREFAEACARLVNRPLRVRRVPAAVAGLLVGRPLADYVQGNLALANIRLRGIGFRFRYPTLEQGIEQVLGALHE